jgi:hypothetical protein
MKKTGLTVVVLLLASLSFSQRQVEVVAEVGLTNQTGTIGGTLYTPQNTGLFRVNFTLQCTGSGTNPQGLYPVIQFTDDNGPDFDQQLGFADDGQPTAPYSWTNVFKAIAGTPITWQVQLLPGDTSPYEVYIALEKIGPKL